MKRYQSGERYLQQRVLYPFAKHFRHLNTCGTQMAQEQFILQAGNIREETIKLLTFYKLFLLTADIIRKKKKN